jgi:hypothetical protein
MGFLVFVPAFFFLKKTHWREKFLRRKLVCFRGVAKSSFFDDLATCFSINSFLPIRFLNINCSVNFDAQEQGESNGAVDYP